MYISFITDNSFIEMSDLMDMSHFVYEDGLCIVIPYPKPQANNGIKTLLDPFQTKV